MNIELPKNWRKLDFETGGEGEKYIAKRANITVGYRKINDSNYSIFLKKNKSKVILTSSLTSESECILHISELLRKYPDITVKAYRNRRKFTLYNGDKEIPRNEIF